MAKGKKAGPKVFGGGKTVESTTVAPNRASTGQVRVFGGAPSLTGRPDQNKPKSGRQTPHAYGGGPTVVQFGPTPTRKGSEGS